MAGGARRLARADAAPPGRLARDARLAGRGRHLGRVACSTSTSTTRSLQLDQQHSWFSSLGVELLRRPVRLLALARRADGRSAAPPRACYAWWAGRERPRAYFGLLLFLTGSVVGVFCAQDLLLFYAFFEAMLIPLYVLIGVWGGAGTARRDDQVRRLHGRRLAADAGGDHRLRRPAGHVRPDARWARARTTGCSSASRSRSR